MKTKLTLTAFLLFTIGITVMVSQIPNKEFEVWDDMGSYMEPEDWWSTNSYSTGSFFPVTRSTDHFPNSLGNYSVRIENNPSLLPNYGALGITWVGEHTMPDPAFPIIGHPTSLTGYYKFFPENGDTMLINVLLFNSGNVYAQGKLLNTEAVAEWTSFDILFNSYSDVDSAQVVLSTYNAVGPDNVPHGNSVLFVDNLNFDSLIISIDELSHEDYVFSLFPNPAHDIVTLNISSSNYAEFVVNIYNVAGSLIRSESIQHKQQNIDVGDLNNGLYLVEIKSQAHTEIQKLIIRR